MKTPKLFPFQEQQAQRLALLLVQHRVVGLSVATGCGKSFIQLRAAQLLYPHTVSIHCNASVLTQYKRSKQQFSHCRVKFNVFNTDFIITK